MSIVIASIGRDTLWPCLESVAASCRAAGVSFEIVIADDTVGGSIAGLAPADAWITVVQTPAPHGNVAAARNTAIAKARGTWLAFIDDDEVASVPWVEELLRTAGDGQSEFVCGSVNPIYPDRAPKALKAARPFQKRWGRTGERIKLGSTSNLLCRKDFLERHDLWFDTTFGKSGGEDSDFLTRAGDLGAVIVASREALVSEHVPASRMKLAYLLARGYHAGHALGRVMVKNGSGGGAPLVLSSVLKAAVLALAAVPCILLAPGRAVRLLTRATENCGKAASVFRLGPLSVYGAAKSESQPS